MGRRSSKSSSTAAPAQQDLAALKVDISGILSSSVNAGATSITVRSAAGFPTTGGFTVMIGGETVQVKSVAINPDGTVTWTLNSATAINHVVGETVTEVYSTATILKESSEVFRVNPPTPPQAYLPGVLQPDLPGPQIINSTNPSVAMDSTGDFIITWQAQVPDYQTQGSVEDILRGNLRRRSTRPTRPSWPT